MPDLPDLAPDEWLATGTLLNPRGDDVAAGALITVTALHPTPAGERAHIAWTSSWRTDKDGHYAEVMRAADGLALRISIGGLPAFEVPAPEAGSVVHLLDLMDPPGEPLTPSQWALIDARVTDLENSAAAGITISDDFILTIGD